MNENTVIKKIKTLKRIEPTSYQLETIKKRVSKRTKNEAVIISPIVRQRVVTAFFVTCFVAAVALGFYQSSFFVKNMIDTVMIQLTQNPYQKAQRSLVLSQQNLLMTQKNVSESNVDSLIVTTVQTNSILAGMNMNGEPGLYTKSDCEQTYKSYIRYLSHLQKQLNEASKKTTDKNLQKKVTDFRSVVTQYHQQADSRLEAYQT
jgi:hypothetical protein